MSKKWIKNALTRAVAAVFAAMICVTSVPGLSMLKPMEVQAGTIEEWTDPKTGIKWHYELINGEINNLYTVDSKEKLYALWASYPLYADYASSRLSQHTIYIPSYINGYPVVSVGGGDASTTVFPQGYGYVNDYNVRYISFPKTLKRINAYAFYQFGENRTSVGTYGEVNSLCDLYLPNLEYIGANAFVNSGFINNIYVDNYSGETLPQFYAQPSKPSNTSYALNLEYIYATNLKNGGVGYGAYSGTKTKTIYLKGNIENYKYAPNYTTKTQSSTTTYTYDYSFYKSSEVAVDYFYKNDKSNKNTQYVTSGKGMYTDRLYNGNGGDDLSNALMDAINTPLGYNESYVKITGFALQNAQETSSYSVDRAEIGVEYKGHGTYEIPIFVSEDNPYIIDKTDFDVYWVAGGTTQNGMSLLDSEKNEITRVDPKYYYITEKKYEGSYDKSLVINSLNTYNQVRQQDQDTMGRFSITVDDLGGRNIAYKSFYIQAVRPDTTSTNLTGYTTRTVTFRIELDDGTHIEEREPDPLADCNTYQEIVDKVKDLNKQISDKTAEIESLTQQLEEAQAGAASVGTLTNQVNTLKAEKAQLEEDLAAANSAKTALEGQVSTLNGQISDLNDQISDLNDTIDEKDAAIAEKDAAIAEKDAQIASLGESNATLTSEKQQLEEEKATLESEKAALQNQVNTLTANVSTLESEKQDALDDLAALQEQYDRLVEENALKDQAISELNSKVATLESTKTSLEGQLSTVTSQKDALQEEYDALEDKSSEQAQTILDQIETLNQKENRITDLLDQVSNLESSNETLSTQLSDTQAAKAALQAEYNALEDTNSEQAQTILDQIAALEAKEAAITQLQNDVAELEGTNRTLSEQLSDVQSEKARLQEEYDSLEDRSSEQAQQILDQIAALQEKEDTITELNDTVTRVSANLDDVSGQLEEKRRDLAELQREYDHIAAELERFKNEHKESGIGFTGKDNEGHDVVYLDAEPYQYDKNSAVDYNINGHAYKLFTGTGDPLGTGASKFQFYLSDGDSIAHVLSGDDNEVVYTKTLWDMIYAADTMLASAQERLALLNGCMDEIAEVLEAAGYHVTPGSTNAETITNVKETVKTMVRDYTAVQEDYSNLKAAIYNGNADEKTLGETIETLNTLYIHTNTVVEELERALDMTVDGEDRAALERLLEKVKEMRENVGGDIALAQELKDALGITNDSEAIPKIQSLYSRIAELEAEIRALTGENTQLKSDKTSMSADLVNLSSEVKKLKEEKANLSAKLASAGSGQVIEKTVTETVYVEAPAVQKPDSTLEVYIAAYDQLLLAYNALTAENAALKGENESLQAKAASAVTTTTYTETIPDTASVEVVEESAASVELEEETEAMDYSVFAGTDIHRIGDLFQITGTDQEIWERIREEMEKAGYEDETEFIVAYLMETYGITAKAARAWLEGDDSIILFTANAQIEEETAETAAEMVGETDVDASQENKAGKIPVAPIAAAGTIGAGALVFGFIKAKGIKKGSKAKKNKSHSMDDSDNLEDMDDLDDLDEAVNG